MKKQLEAMNNRHPITLLGGSVSDWLVLVIGVLLAGIVAAAFAG